MQIVLLTLFLIGITAPAFGYQCGRPPILPEDNRIVGGAEAIQHSWPWQVLLEITTKRNKTDYEFETCGGTIISNYWILTAAHCFDDAKHPNDVKVFSASHYANTPAVLHKVKNVIVHEKYDEEKHYDIALVELKSPIKYNKRTQPICLPSYDKDVELSTKVAWATGWGALEFEGRSSNVLREIQLPFVDMRTCRLALQEDNDDFQFNKKLQICAGQKGRDTCQGDSGGPLALIGDDGRWYQLGITSWGVGCGDTPGVYTRVTGYCDWIYSTTDGDVGCLQP